MKIELTKGITQSFFSILIIYFKNNAANIFFLNEEIRLIDFLNEYKRCYLVILV